MAGILSKIEEEILSTQTESDYCYKGIPAPQMASDEK